MEALCNCFLHKRHIHNWNDSINCLKAWRGPPYSQGGTGKNGFISDMRLRDSGTWNNRILKTLSFNKFTLFIIIRGPQRGTGANEGVGRSGTSRKGKRNEITPFLMLGINLKYVEKETNDLSWEMLANYINSHEV